MGEGNLGLDERIIRGEGHEAGRCRERLGEYVSLGGGSGKRES